MTTETTKPRTLEEIVEWWRAERVNWRQSPDVEALVREAYALGAASRASLEARDCSTCEKLSDVAAMAHGDGQRDAGRASPEEGRADQDDYGIGYRDGLLFTVRSLNSLGYRDLADFFATKAMAPAPPPKDSGARETCDPDCKGDFHVIGCPKRAPEPICTCKGRIGFGYGFRGFMFPDPACPSCQRAPASKEAE